MQLILNWFELLISIQMCELKTERKQVLSEIQYNISKIYIYVYIYILALNDGKLSKILGEEYFF